MQLCALGNQNQIDRTIPSQNYCLSQQITEWKYSTIQQQQKQFLDLICLCYIFQSASKLKQNNSEISTILIQSYLPPNSIAILVFALSPTRFRKPQESSILSANVGRLSRRQYYQRLNIFRATSIGLDATGCLVRLNYSGLNLVPSSEFLVQFHVYSLLEIQILISNRFQKCLLDCPRGFIAISRNLTFVYFVTIVLYKVIPKCDRCRQFVKLVYFYKQWRNVVMTQNDNRS
ncbi:Hypothetical_protein [Hexamita inflata]|uniref:Hypothetical_protein n=1 Tax=Hexamita inflata TaxID=28002 RepID=A0AA86PYT9_9EUKA|nr:Hypothetical protein HINF_LOCUS33983 [Hexamita inflata]